MRSGWRGWPRPRPLPVAIARATSWSPRPRYWPPQGQARGLCFIATAPDWTGLPCLKRTDFALRWADSVNARPAQLVERTAPAACHLRHGATRLSVNRRLPARATSTSPEIGLHDLRPPTASGLAKPLSLPLWPTSEPGRGLPRKYRAFLRWQSLRGRQCLLAPRESLSRL